jgi:hypothetical protein
MKALLPVAVMIGLAAPAYGQVRSTNSYPSSAEIRAAGDSQAAQIASRSQDVTDRFDAFEDRARRQQCLRENRTGKVFCGTREQWSVIASRLAAGRSWRD